MKLLILFCSVLLLALTVQTHHMIVEEEGPTENEVGPREPHCPEYEVNSSCTREYNPVCGDDGHTYPTECMLCQHNKLESLHLKVDHTGVC